MWKKHTLIIFIISVLSVLIYSNTFDASFHFDDRPSIVDNVFCHMDTLSLNGLIRAADLNHSVFRPLSYVTFALNYYFGKLNVFGYHLVNLIIHILAGVFLYCFIYLLLNLPRLRDRYGESSFEASAFSALLFISNPVQTQAVTYIVQRMTSMAAMFYFLSLLLYLLARTQVRHKFALFLLSFLSGTCAMMSKETAVTLPFFVVLLEYLFLSQGDRKTLKKQIILIFLSAGLIGGLASILLGAEILSEVEYLFTQNPLGIGLRLLTEARVVLYYLSLLFFPIPSRLNIYHDFPVSQGWLSPPATLFSVLVLVFLIVYAFQSMRKRSLVSLCILWYFGNLVLESTVVPLALTYEHRLYLPSAGVFLLITTVLTRKTFRFRSLSLAVLAVSCIVSSVFAYQRNQVWQNEITLWTDTVQKSPNLHIPLANLGSAYMDIGLYNEAIEALNQSIRIKPNAEAYGTLSSIFMVREQFDKAADNIQKAIALKPDKGRWYAILGRIYQLQSRYEEAWEAFSTAVTKDERILISGEFEGRFDFLREKLITLYEEKIRFGSGDAESRFELGNLYLSKKQIVPAQEEFAEILKLQPEHIGALNNMAYIYMQQRMWDPAEEILQRIIEIDKNFESAYLNLGMLYLEMNQKQKARENLEKALMLANNPERQQMIQRIIRKTK